MSEPTREQIKEAFKKTIERWEKIVERPYYHDESECKLCFLETKHHQCSDFCPIRLYTGIYGCNNTPYGTFNGNQTPANALAELNFLRKVYIWWMEGDDKDKSTGVVREEKKEWSAWVDITENIRAEIYIHADGTAVVRLYDGSNRFGYMKGEVSLCQDDKENYKIKDSDFYFRILKKA